MFAIRTVQKRSYVKIILTSFSPLLLIYYQPRLQLYIKQRVIDRQPKNV